MKDVLTSLDLLSQMSNTFEANFLVFSRFQSWLYYSKHSICAACCGKHYKILWSCLSGISRYLGMGLFHHLHTINDFK